MAARRRIAQADANQVTARTSMPSGRPRAGVTTQANQPSAGRIGRSRGKPLAPVGGELARMGRDQRPTRGEAAALAALRGELGG